MNERYFIVSYVGTDKKNQTVTGEIDFHTINGIFLNRKRVTYLIENGNSLHSVIITFILEITHFDWQYWTAKDYN